MHIAFFTNTYHPWVSGVVRSISAFRKALSERGHNVFVFAQEAGDYIDAEPFIFRYPSIPIPYPIDFHAVIPISSFIDHLLPSLKLDIIHTHHPVLLGQAAAKKAEELNLPLVFTFHSQYSEYSQYIPISQENIQDFIKEVIGSVIGEYLKKCHHIIVPSNSMLDILDDEYGIEKEYVSVVPTGTDIKLFQNADGRPIREKFQWGDDVVMLSVGRLAPEKNWKLFIDACAIVINAKPNFRAVIIGEGFEREKLEKQAASLGIERRIQFLGDVPYEEIPAYYKAADLFGFTSTAETQGIVTMEALSAGLPVVAVDAVGTRDNVINNQQGFLTGNDVTDFADAILSLMNNPDLRQQFSQAAAERAKDFDISVQTEKLLNAYQKAIQSFQAGQSVILTRTRNIFSFGT